MRRIVLAMSFLLAYATSAFAQSGCSTIVTGAVLTAAQWNACFSAKQNVLGFTPLSVNGGVMTGRLVTAASTTTAAGFNIPAGTAPTSPTNGDIWTTSTGIFAYVNGSTVALSAGLLANGSLGAPSLAFASEPTLGLYRVAAKTLGIVTGSGGTVVINTNTVNLPAPTVGTNYVHFGGPDGANGRVLFDSFGTGSVGSSALDLRRANGTAAAPSALQLNDNIGQLSWFGYGATTYSTTSRASIRAFAAENWTDTAQGSKVSILTTAIGSTTGAERVAISDVGTLSITPVASSLAKGLAIAQNPTGTSAASQNYNEIICNPDSAVLTGGNFGLCLNVSHVINGATVQGGRIAFQTYLQLAAPTSASNSNRNYVATLFTGTATSGDGGTNTGAGALGAIFAAGMWGDAQSGATNLLNVTAGEMNCSIRTGASAKNKSCIQLVEHSLDAIAGATTDAMLAISAQVGASGVSDGILFSDFAGQHAIKSTGTLFRTTGGTVAVGVDLSLSTISGNAWASNNASITGAGVATFSSLNLSGGAFTITSSSASALAVGRLGATTPAFQVDSSTASSVTGVKITANTASNGAQIAALSSDANDSLSILAKGTGTVQIGTGSQQVTIGGTAGTIALRFINDNLTGFGSRAPLETNNYANSQETMRWAQSVVTSFATFRANSNLVANATQTIASGASVAWNDFEVASHTTTLTGTTTITSPFAKSVFFGGTLTNASAVTVNNAAAVFIDAAPVAAGSVTIGAGWSLFINSGRALFGGGLTTNIGSTIMVPTQTIVSAGAAVWSDLELSDSTMTLTGTTTVNALARAYIGGGTITDSSSVTVTSATTMFVAAPPAAGGSVTITNPWAFRVGSGNAGLPAGGYLNFGATGSSSSGTNGYGIRDNGGVMEKKNSGGAWSAL